MTAYTFIGQGAHGGGDALVGEDAATDDLRDAQIVEDQSQIGTGQRAVGCLDNDDLIRLRSNLGNDLRFPFVLGQQQIIPAGQPLTERSIASITRLAGNAGEQYLVSVAPEPMQKLWMVGMTVPCIRS